MGVAKYRQVLQAFLGDAAPLGVLLAMWNLNAESGDVSPWNREMGRLKRHARARRSLSDYFHLARYRRAVNVVMLMFRSSALDPLGSIEDVNNTVAIRGCHN